MLWGPVQWVSAEAVDIPIPPFQCDLKALPSLPPVLLIGETHPALPSKSVKMFAASLASDGRIYLGVEETETDAAFAGHEKEIYQALLQPAPSEEAVSSKDLRIVGIDSPIPYSLVILYEFTSKRSIKDFVYFLRRNEFARLSWEEAKRSENDFMGSPLQPIAEAIDRGMNGDSGWEAGIDALNGSFREIALKINAAAVKIANERYLPEMGLSVRLSPVGVSASPGRLSWQDSFTVVEVAVRDRDMAINVERLYCRAAQKGSPVVAIVGAAHVPGMKKILEISSAGQLPLEQPVDSKMDSEAAITEIERIAYASSEKGPRIVRFYMPVISPTIPSNFDGTKQ